MTRRGRGGYRPRGGRRRNPYRRDRTKMMVTGKPPTLVEKIASGVGSVARLAGAVAPIIAAINTEHKYIDTDIQLTAYNPGTNDDMVLLTSIVQGTDDVNRIGNSVLAKTLAIKAQMSYTADSTDLIATYRFTLFVWKANANSNPPSVSKIFEAPNSFLSAFNKDYTDQMVILKDKIIAVNSQTIPVSQQSGNVFMKVFKKLNFHLRWLDATTGITENHVYVLFRSDNLLVGNAATCQLYSRLIFTDN